MIRVYPLGFYFTIDKEFVNEYKRLENKKDRSDEFLNQYIVLCERIRNRFGTTKLIGLGNGLAPNKLEIVVYPIEAKKNIYFEQKREENNVYIEIAV